jgi:hypothetical protein
VVSSKGLEATSLFSAYPVERVNPPGTSSARVFTCVASWLSSLIQTATFTPLESIFLSRRIVISRILVETTGARAGCRLDLLGPSACSEPEMAPLLGINCDRIWPEELAGTIAQDGLVIPRPEWVA